MRWLKRLGFAVTGLFILLAIAGFFLHFNQEYLVYRPFPGGRFTPENLGLSYEDLHLTTKDGETIHAWFIDLPNERGTILYCHGNAGNIRHRRKAIRGLTALGFDVLIFDYRGYGESTGGPSEAGTYEDARTAWRFLTEDKGIAEATIVVWGRSLGGGIASWVAAEFPHRALVLESTFTSLPDLALELYGFIPDGEWVDLKYPSLERVKSLRTPLLIAHSRGDTLIGFHHGEKLRSATTSTLSTFVELTGDHAGGHLTQSRHRAAVMAFFATAPSR